MVWQTAVFTDSFMEPLFKAIERCEGVRQREDYHPEVFVVEHLMQCFHIALKETYDVDLVLAALLHDVGKFESTHGHEKIGADLLADCVAPKTIFLIENHIRIKDFLDGSMVKVGKARKLIEHPWFVDLVHLSRIDQAGRKGGKKTKYDKEDIVKKLVQFVDKRFIYNQNRS